MYTRIKLGAGGFLAIAILVGSLGSFTLVDAGEVGVVKKFGEVTGRVLDPGFHFKAPFVDSVLTYNTKKDIYQTQREPEKRDAEGITTDYAVDTNTSDGQQVDIFFTVRYSVDPTQASWIAQNIGSQELLIDKVIKPEARIWARSVPREFVAADLYSGSVVDVQNKIADALRPVYETNGVIFDSVGIREIEFDEKYVSAIENKQIEAVKIETAQNQAEAAKFDKEKRITEAQAQAEEQRLQSQTLDSQVLEKIQQDNLGRAIDKWKGDVPAWLFMGSDGISDLILNPPTN